MDDISLLPSAGSGMAMGGRAKRGEEVVEGLTANVRFDNF